MHVFPGRFVQGLQERQGELSQADVQWAEQARLPQPQPDLVLAVGSS
jgi:hypothetical protein